MQQLRKLQKYTVFKAKYKWVSLHLFSQLQAFEFSPISLFKYTANVQSFTIKWWYFSIIHSSCYNLRKFLEENFSKSNQSSTKNWEKSLKWNVCTKIVLRLSKVRSIWHRRGLFLHPYSNPSSRASVAIMFLLSL